MRLLPIFIQDELNDEPEDALKYICPDALYVCGIKTANPLRLPTCIINSVDELDLPAYCTVKDELPHNMEVLFFCKRGRP